MSQLNLPWSNPQDRGKLNALRNIIATVPDDLRRQAPTASSIVYFTTDQLPGILRQHTPLPLLNADPSQPESLSPYPFEIFDFVTQRPANSETFSTVSELLANIPITQLAAPLRDIELIGIDESKVDTPLPQSTFTFLKSVAFRMCKLPDGSIDEAVGPMLSKLYMQLGDDESFESRNKLLGYIRNNFVAYITLLTSLSFGRKPFIILHGPLVRTIGGFSDIIFNYETARDLLNINVDEASEYELPAQNSTPVLSEDVNTRQNMSTTLKDAIDGEKNLHRFNEFCLHKCGRRCANGIYPESAVPWRQAKVDKNMVKGRDYPGFCLYFWMLRSLFDATHRSDTTVASVVENTSSATEMTRLVLPSLFATPQAHQQIERSALKNILNVLREPRLESPNLRRDLYRQVKRLIETIRLSDANIFSYVLAEGQYTAPVQIYRYRTRNTFEEALGYGELGIRNSFENILNVLFPESPSNTHPGYRVLMSYLRTTPLREPVRVEYFGMPKFANAQNVIGPIYLLSLPYQEYGLPVILYYADKLARTPTQLVRIIIEREYLELVLENRFSDPVSIMKVLGRFTRGYFQREGFR